jgi:REP element-mobilizing transposase RayT
MTTPHRKRPALEGVVHVTHHVTPGLPSLRTRAAFDVVREAIRAGCERRGFRVVAFSVLSNHLHYVVEGASTECVARGMQGLSIRIAKALNRAWGRRGKVFGERYFARVARGMNAVRRVLTYVLQNARRHRVRLPRGVPDPYSSGPWFRFWRERPPPHSGPAPVAEMHDAWLVAAAQWRPSLDDLPGLGRGP